MWRLFKYFLFFLFVFELINRFFNAQSNIFAIILSIIYALIIVVGIYKYRSNTNIDIESPSSVFRKITSFTTSFIKLIFLAFVIVSSSIGFFMVHDAKKNRVEGFKYAALLQEYCIANKECKKINPAIKSWGLNIEKEKFNFFVPEWLDGGTSFQGGVNEKLTAIIHRDLNRELCVYSIETKKWSCQR